MWRDMAAIVLKLYDGQSRQVEQETCGAAMACFDKVAIGNNSLENAPNFERPGSRLQSEGKDEADVCHRMITAQSAFGSLSHL